MRPNQWSELVIEKASFTSDVLKAALHSYTNDANVVVELSSNLSLIKPDFRV